MVQLPIYLDYNATTPCDPRVVEAMLPYFNKFFGNAASHSHVFGWQAEEAVEQARAQVARLIGSETQEIIFTSGATESNNLAIKGVFETYASKGNHIITVVTEHKAVLDTCKHLEKLGASVTYLPVSSEGLISLTELEAAITDKTVLVAVMYANNEIGTIQSISKIAEIARKHNVVFFTDAAQAAGKIPINVNTDNIDLMSLSAHKMYGPKGIGALYVRRKNPRIKLAPQMDGGGHERGLRSGTLNVPAIVGFGKACEICTEEMEAESERMSALRDDLENGILKLENTSVNGSKEHRLPNLSNISFGEIQGNNLLVNLNKEIAVAAGSACTSALPEPSHVLKALGLEDVVIKNSIRFGVGRFTTKEEIEYVIEYVGKVVQRLRDAMIA